MTKHIITRYSSLSTILRLGSFSLSTRYSALITFMFLLLFLPVFSWAADGVIQLPRTGQTTCYGADGKVISCSGTGQDGDIQAGVAWPIPRFVDNGDGTVTDRLTGLMWIKGDTEEMTWQAALDYVKRLNTGSHTDWRLPNVEELRSLVDYSQTNPSLPPGHPFTNVVASYYWSSTTYAFYSGYAWYVNFYFGSGGGDGGDKSLSSYVRAVRGGQCVPLGDSVICLPKTGQTKCYDTAGAEFSCAGTGQDGDIQAGVVWPSPRFTDHGDGTVTDKLTGLMWIIDEAGEMTWQAALDYVKTLNTGGHTDWRLPNVEELRSLVGYTQANPSLPPGHPFTNVETSGYWSSTTYAYRTGYAWYVSFGSGGVYGYNGGVGDGNKSNGTYTYVRAVRGGQVDDNSNTTTTASPGNTTTTTMPPCPTKTALGEQARELQPLRAFRDGVMKRSNQGREYAELYYRNALEISSLLEAHPKLKGESQRLILKLLPTVQALLAQKDGKIDAGNVTQATALLDNLSALGSPSLRADLVQLKKEMQSGSIFDEFHISVAGGKK